MKTEQFSDEHDGKCYNKSFKATHKSGYKLEPRPSGEVPSIGNQKKHNDFTFEKIYLAPD